MTSTREPSSGSRQIGPMPLVCLGLSTGGVVALFGRGARLRAGVRARSGAAAGSGVAASATGAGAFAIGSRVASVSFVGASAAGC